MYKNINLLPISKYTLSSLNRTKKIIAATAIIFLCAFLLVAYIKTTFSSKAKELEEINALMSEMGADESAGEREQLNQLNARLKEKNEQLERLTSDAASVTINKDDILPLLNSKAVGVEPLVVEINYNEEKKVSLKGITKLIDGLQEFTKELMENPRLKAVTIDSIEAVYDGGTKFEVSAFYMQE